MPLPPQSLFNDLISWTASASMTGAYGGSIVLTNQLGQYTFDTLKYTPFRIGMTSKTVHSSLADSSCFDAEDSPFIYGIVHGVDHGEDVNGGDFVTVKIRSFVSQLSKKAINTTKYRNTVSEVLADLANIYGGIPNTLYSFASSTKLIYAVISGNNLLEEMIKVATVGRQYLFVNRSGILVSSPWKDHNSSVDVDIPDAAVIEATQSPTIEPGATRFTVRGRFISVFECGSVHLGGGGEMEPLKAKPINPPEYQGTTKVCSNQGIGQPNIPVRINGIRGTKEDLRNAEVTVTEGDGEYDFTKSINPDGSMDVTLRGVGDTYLGSGAKVHRIEVTGRRKPSNERMAAAAQMGPLTGNQGLQQKVNQGYLKLGQPVPLELPGAGGKGVKANNNDKMADEPEPIRIEMFVNDPDLQAEYGVIAEQIDDLYASDYETLFEMAIRKFQEYKMSRKMWRVTVKFLPCLQLNQVVTFRTPKTGTEITGLLTDIQTDWDHTPNANMALTILSMEDIGNTEYVSGNLFMYPEMCGSNGVDWLASVDGDAFVRHMGGYVSMGHYTGGNATLWQPFVLEPGMQYDFYCNLVKDSGGNMTISVKDSGTHASSVASATTNDFHISFVPDEASNIIEFTTAGKWYMTRPRLMKTKTA